MHSNHSVLCVLIERVEAMIQQIMQNSFIEMKLLSNCVICKNELIVQQIRQNNFIYIDLLT